MTATLPIPREAAIGLLHQMLRIRRFEERCAQRYQQEHIRGFLHLYIGEEAIATGVMAALREDDPVLATYREHGHALARGVPADTILAEMEGKAEGCSGGRGGSMHLFDVARHFYGGSAIVAGHLPMAVGVALGDRMQGRDRVTACFFGEGAVAEGEFHEAMNLAALWRAPVLFCCENNLYAMGTALERSEAQTSIVAKASGYNVPAQQVDGMDPIAVFEATRAAVASMRAGGGPVLLEFRTYRFRAHSMFDAQHYRTKDEVAAQQARDPLVTFPARLRAAGWLDDDAMQAMETAVAEEIDAAVAFAEAGTLEPVEALTRFVHAEEAP